MHNPWQKPVSGIQQSSTNIYLFVYSLLAVLIYSQNILFSMKIVILSYLRSNFYIDRVKLKYIIIK